MREIKFRGIALCNKEFVYGGVTFLDGVYGIIQCKSVCIEEETNSWENQPVHFGIKEGTLGQYTGLKDKNRKEIYEGDKVKLLYTDWMSKSSSDPRTIDEYLDYISKIYSIVYEGDRFWVSRFSDKYKENFTSSIYPGEHGFIEIIGSIHENKELLT